MAKLVIPRNASELEEILNGDRLGEMVNEGQLPEFIQAYSATMATDEIRAQITEQTQLGLANAINDGVLTNEVKRLNQTKIREASATRSKEYNKRAAGAPLDGIYDDIGELVRANSHLLNKMADRKELTEKLTKATSVLNSYGSIVPADGGFLIPETMRDDILAVSLEEGVMRSRSTVIPMESLTLKVPMIDDTSHASSVYGGIIAYWTEEAAALAESQASFGAIKLEADKLTAYAEYPNELAQDASAFSRLVQQWMTKAVSYFEDVAFIDGNGAGQPLGFLNADASVSVPKETGQAANTIVWENIVKMYSRMLPSSLGTAVWVANNDTFPELATMALSVGTGGSAVWLNNGVAGPPMTILGRPVIFTEKVPTLGSAGDISFLDASYYLIGDRQQMTVDISPHFKFQNDKLALRVIERVTGRPWVQSALTPRSGSSNTLSPYVKIAVRA